MSNEDLSRSSSNTDNVLEDLPSGWKRRESKSHPGRYFYISPTGQTQWVRPLEKEEAPQKQNWRMEVEIEFGPGRLGVGLREIDQFKNDCIQYPQFQVEIDDFPKLPNGKAGPAEIYNWSVKPEKRLTNGMRVVSIGNTILSGFSYKEVIDTLKKSTRPIKIRFVNVELGTLEDGEPVKLQPMEPLFPEEKKKASAFSIQKQMITDYHLIQVLSEIRNEIWDLSSKKLHEKKQIVRKKLVILFEKYQYLIQDMSKLKSDEEDFRKRKNSCIEKKNHLKLQQEGLIESDEKIKTTQLVQRNEELMQDVETLRAGNKKLSQQRDNFKKSLEEIHGMLLKYDDQTIGVDVDGMDPKASLEDKYRFMKEKIKSGRDDLKNENNRVNQLEEEIAQLSKQLDGIKINNKKETKEFILDDDDDDGNMNQERKPRIQIELEQQIQSLRKDLHETVKAMAHAAKQGDKEKASEYAHKREKLKKELAKLQDELGRRMQDIQKDLPSKITKTETLKIPTHSGILEKVSSESRRLKGHRNTQQTKPLWCILDSNGILSFYKKQGDMEPRGSFNLDEESLEIVCMDDPKKFGFDIITCNKQTSFLASSPQELSTWIQCLRMTQSILMKRKHQQQRKEKDRNEYRNAQRNSNTLNHSRSTLAF